MLGVQRYSFSVPEFKNIRESIEGYATKPTDHANSVVANSSSIFGQEAITSINRKKKMLLKERKLFNFQII